MDKILRIDMGADGGPKFTVESLGDYAGLGGRAMTSAVINKEVPALCHPLGADNKLVIAPGIIDGDPSRQGMALIEWHNNKEDRADRPQGRARPTGSGAKRQK